MSLSIAPLNVKNYTDDLSGKINKIPLREIAKSSPEKKRMEGSANINFNNHPLKLKIERAENYKHDKLKRIEIFFDIYNDNKQPAIEAFAYVKYPENELPILEMGINKHPKMANENKLKGLGKALYNEMADFMINELSFNQGVDFRRIITRDPALSESDRELTREEWMKFFGPTLESGDFKKIENDEDGNERWEKIYHTKNQPSDTAANITRAQVNQALNKPT